VGVYRTPEYSAPSSSSFTVPCVDGVTMWTSMAAEPTPSLSSGFRTCATPASTSTKSSFAEKALASADPADMTATRVTTAVRMQTRKARCASLGLWCDGIAEAPV
jgi:hypothetical protein